MHVIHRHEAVAVQPMRRKAYNYENNYWIDDAGQPITKVLLRCCCGGLKTKTLEGTWTLEQVRGEEN